MKTTVILSFLIFVKITLFANENWIKIEPINNAQTPKSNIKLDVNLSQIEPINKMMKNATAIKQLVDATNKKEAAASNEKHWFVLNSEESQ